MRWVPGLLLSLVPVVSFAGTPFEDRATYIEVSGPGAPSLIGLAVADFNGDSVTDVAGPVRYKDIAFLLQDPAHQGWTARQYPTEDHDFDFGSAAAADLNGDGFMDLICMAPPCALRVILGPLPESTGEEDIIHIHNTGFSSGPCEVNLADLNRDGFLDLVGARYGYLSPPAAAVFALGRGDGTFADPTEILITAPWPGTSYTSVVKPADFDGDELPDLAAAVGGEESHSRVSVLLQSGLEFREVWANHLGGTVQSLEALDIDGDALGDLLVLCEGLDSGPDPRIQSSLHLFRGVGGGLLEERGTFFMEELSGIAKARDLNGDGLAEVAAVTRKGMFRIWRQDQPWDFSLAQACAAVPQPFEFGDIDGDATLDAVFADYPLVLRGRGDGTFHAAPAVFECKLDLNRVVVGDVDRDGIPDILSAFLNFSGLVELSFLRGDGRAGFLPPVTTSLNTPYPILDSDMQLGDIDGDRNPDAVIATYALDQKSRLAVIPGDGKGAFHDPYFLECVPILLETADLDGDGKDEIVALTRKDPTSWHDPGKVLVVRQSAPGALEVAGVYADGIKPRAMGLADTDGDGRKDLVIFGETSAEVPLLGPITFAGNADGTFGPPRPSNPEGLWYYSTPEFERIRMGDWDGDGMGDLIQPNGYIPGRGDGTFGPFHGVEIYPPYLSESGSPEPADFDLDGHLDLAYGWHNLDVVFGAGDGSVSRKLACGGMYTRQALVADLDRDGAPDVVSAGYIIAVYHNETLVSGVPGFIRGDSNGDREIDIADPVFTLGFLFLGLDGPRCADAADADDSGGLNLSDPIYTLSYSFLGGSPPGLPFPACGPDPTPDAIPCEHSPQGCD